MLCYECQLCLECAATAAGKNGSGGGGGGGSDKKPGDSLRKILRDKVPGLTWARKMFKPSPLSEEELVKREKRKKGLDLLLWLHKNYDDRHNKQAISIQKEITQFCEINGGKISAAYTEYLRENRPRNKNVIPSFQRDKADLQLYLEDKKTSETKLTRPSATDFFYDSMLEFLGEISEQYTIDPNAPPYVPPPVSLPPARPLTEEEKLRNKREEAAMRERVATYPTYR